MIQTPITDNNANPDIPAHLTAAWVAIWLGDFSRRIGKVWPLQTVNACNPLAAYEHLPFQAALEQAVKDLDFSPARSLQVFKRLYQEQAFTDQDIESVLAADEQPWLNQTIDCLPETMTYREILFHELRLALTAGDAVHSTEKDDDLNWPTVAKQALEHAISNWYQDHAPANEIHSEQGVSIHPCHMTWINEQTTKWLAA